jgi:hypothetical protein
VSKDEYNLRNDLFGISMNNACILFQVKFEGGLPTSFLKKKKGGRQLLIKRLRLEIDPA